MQNDIFRDIHAMAPELIQLRRDFHRFPETAWTEYRTTDRIAAALEALGYEVLLGRAVCDEAGRMALPSPSEDAAALERARREGVNPARLAVMAGGFTGAIGILRCGEGPTVALRFDIDALPVTESADPEHFPSREGFSSRHPGLMHACGHDGHITVGLGCAKWLRNHRDELHGTVKLIFQPAEEGVRGARSVVQNGHLDGVDFLLGAHMGGEPDSPVGLYLDSGATLATTKLDAVFHGRSAHAGAAPEEGHNALLAAATAVLNLHAIPRCGGADTRINVGRMVGGSGRNVVCAEARLELEVRGETAEANQFMESYARCVLRSAAEMHGCTVELAEMGGADNVPNSPALAHRLVTLWRENGFPVDIHEERRWSVSEDFSRLARRVLEQSGEVCYFHLYSPCPAGLHQSKFDFSEEALPLGVEAFCAAARELLK